MGSFELAIVLAMQVLGGDPQAAYLLGLAGVGYAASPCLEPRSRRPGRRGRFAPAGAAPDFGWVGRRLWSRSAWRPVGSPRRSWRPCGFPGCARLIPAHRRLPCPGCSGLPTAVTCAGGRWHCGFFYRLAQGAAGDFRFGRDVAGPGLLGRARDCLTAAQLLPVIEFTQQTARAAGGGPHEIYPFSIEPYRLVEMVWPNISGIQFEGNTYWVDCSRIPGRSSQIWVPSLYLGGLTSSWHWARSRFARARPGACGFR